MYQIVNVVSITENIELFCEYLRVERKYSPHTVLSYRNDLLQFSDFISKSYEIDDCTQIRHTFVRTWIVELMSNEIMSSSVNRKISALRSWHKFMLKRKVISSNPLIKIVAPKKSRRLPVSVHGTDMSSIIEPSMVTHESDQLFNLRDALIVEMLYSTGIRRAELISINITDINTQRKELRVIGKGNKVRIIPVSDKLMQSYSKYVSLLKHSDISKEDQALFITNKGKRIYEKMVHMIVKQKLSDVTTLTKKSPHVLRHTFATHMLDAGADLNAIKEILGHANLAATQVYTHNSISKLKEAYAKSHPRSGG